MMGAARVGVRWLGSAKGTLELIPKRQFNSKVVVAGAVPASKMVLQKNGSLGGVKKVSLHTTAGNLTKENEAAVPVERFGGPGAKGQPAPSRVEKTVNQTMLMGRVGGDPQMRGTTEHPVVVFSVATHANYNYQSGEMLQKTDWHRVCVFKPYLRDSVYKYMTKGQRVYITGRISYGEIEDDQGKSHTTTSIIADDVIFISDSKNKSAPGGA